MRILISVLVNYFKTYGTTIRARKIVSILKNNYDIIIITRASFDDELTYNVNDKDRFEYKKITPEFTKLWNLKIIPPIFNSKCDLVYCCNDWFGFFTYWIFSKVKKYKIIFEAHGILSEEIKELGANSVSVIFYRVLERFVIKRADFVIVLSENIFEYYKQYNTNIEIIPVFIEEDILDKSKFCAEQKKEQRFIKKIGIIGPFEGKFNRHTLEFIYENIEIFDSRIHFLIIGNCQNKIAHDRIKYTGHLDKNDDYIQTLCSMDAILVPVKIATSGPLNKILEPMACSVPVFTTPKGLKGINNLHPGNDIFVFEEEDLISQINTIIFDKNLLDWVGSNARMAVEKNYREKIYAERIEFIIKRLT